MIELEQEHGTLQNFLRSQDDFAATVKTMRKDFKFLGEIGCYHFLYVVGEALPSHDEVMKK